MESYIIVAVVFLAIGFVLGGLVYKSNAKKIDSTVATVQKVASDVGQVAADVKKV